MSVVFFASSRPARGTPRDVPGVPRRALRNRCPRQHRLGLPQAVTKWRPRSNGPEGELAQPSLPLSSVPAPAPWPGGVLSWGCFVSGRPGACGEASRAGGWAASPTSHTGQTGKPGTRSPVCLGLEHEAWKSLWSKH